MRERLVAALAVPFPVAQGQQVCAVLAVGPQCHGRRREGACIRRARLAGPVGKGLPGAREPVDRPFRDFQVVGDLLDDEGSDFVAVRGHGDGRLQSSDGRMVQNFPSIGDA